MKIKFKKSLLLAFVSAGLVAGAVGAAGVSPVKASAAGVSTDIVMKTGASLYLDEISGLKFSYTVSNYDADKNYGMLIVPFDYLDEAGITDLTLAENDYVPALMQAKADGAIAYEPIVIENLTPNAENVIEYSIGDIQETNYVRQFFGIGFIKSGDTYTYATQDDNVRSVFEVANRAVNKLNFGAWDMENEKEVKEKELLQNNEENVLNPFINKGIEFVYGAGTTLDISLATYVNGNVNPTITTAKEKDVAFDVQWNYNSANLTRGENQTVTASIGTAFNATTDSAKVLADAIEFEMYSNSKNAYFFNGVNAPVVENTYTAQLKGGYWNDFEASSGYEDPGYFAIKNPNAENGQYSISKNGNLYMDFYFKGNNMPIVEFFGTTIENLSLGKRSDATSSKTAPTGYVVFNGAARSATYKYWDILQEAGKDTTNFTITDASGAVTGVLEGMETHSNWRYGGLFTRVPSLMYGMSDYGTTNDKFDRKRFSSTSTSSGTGFLRHFDQGETVSMLYNSGSTVSNWAMKDVANVSKFSIYSLMNEGEETYWHYQVGISMSSTSRPALNAKLWKTDANGNHIDADTSTADTVDAFATYTKKSNCGSMTAASSGRSGYVIVYGALKGDATDAKDRYNTQLAYTMPYSK